MRSFQKMGGAAALIEALTYIVGFTLALTLLADFTAGTMDRGEALTFLADNYALLYTWNMTIYVVNGIFLVVLALALYERLKAGSPALAQTGTAFGLIWAGLVLASGMLILIDLDVVGKLYLQDPAQADLAWLILSAVEKGLGGGIEIVGGVWVLLISVAALRSGGLPRALNYLGVIIGVAGILTIIPPISEIGAVFGLGFILWFFWVGIVMLRDRSGLAASVARA